MAPGPAAADGRKRGQPFCRHGPILRDEAAKRAVTRRNYEFFGASVVTYLGLERSLAPWSIFDVGVLTISVMLVAQEYGVDSIPAVSLVAYPDLIRAELGVPENLLILLGIALGYGGPECAANRHWSLRRSIQEVVRFKGL